MLNKIDDQRHGMRYFIDKLAEAVGSQRALAQEISDVTQERVSDSMVSNWKYYGVSWRFRPAVAKIAASKGLALPEKWLLLDKKA